MRRTKSLVFPGGIHGFMRALVKPPGFGGCRGSVFGAVIAILASAFHPGPTWAAKGAELCDQAARYASERTGVPLDVLRAITRTETGRKASGSTPDPWPWTVNMEGVGKWFDTRADALRFAELFHERGARSFDVGCFQINYRWHGNAFGSIGEMFDPRANALYAARFLLRQYARTGDWSKAAGAYHSGTQVYAARYRKRFDTIRGALGPAVSAPAALARTAALRHNAFPLLTAGGVGTPGRLGSLVPRTDGGGALLTSKASSLGVDG